MRNSSTGNGISRPACAARAAFTLAELLVVLGIILLLMGILLPTISKMTDAGRKADTANQLNVLRTAVEQYYQTFQAYPGPLDDREIYGAVPWNSTTKRGLPSNVGGGSITMAENLVLGLLGGLKMVQTSPSTYDLQFDPALIVQSKGPRGLNPAAPKSYNSFLDSIANQISPGSAASLQFQNPRDTIIPEFLDKFGDDRRPILYLRARKGAGGIIGDGDSINSKTGVRELFQYDIRQIQSYTVGRTGGLSELGILLGPPGPNRLNPLFRQGMPSPALPYFVNRQVPISDLSSENGARYSGTPRSKDGFILISAGLDRLYGTADDITSFGSFD
jgi:competence protein ComGC